jgi:hypothetical protein
MLLIFLGLTLKLFDSEEHYYPDRRDKHVAADSGLKALEPAASDSPSDESPGYGGSLPDSLKKSALMPKLSGV